MAVYNGERYLREAIDSVLGQTFTDFEFLIIDDASVDHTPEIIAEYTDREQRIVVLRNQVNKGLTKSLNKGLRVARGEYIARQDADDVSLPSRFEMEIGVLDRQPDVVLVSGNIDLIDSDGHVWRRPRRTGCPRLVAWYLLFYNYLGGHSQVMFRRQPVVDLGGYSEEHPYGQDYELWLRLAEAGKIIIVPDVLLRYRDHEDNLSSSFAAAQRQYNLIASRRATVRLLGEEHSIAEVAELRAFWLSPFPDVRATANLNRRLRGLFWAFLHEQAREDVIDRYFARELSRLVGRQFLSWAHVLGVDGKACSMLKTLGYALSWYLSGFMVPRSHGSSQ